MTAPASWRLVSILLAIGAAGCASTGAVPKPFPGAAGASGVGIPSAGRFTPAAVVQTAMGFRGAPYRNGGSDPSGFDCSGFVQYVFKQHGLALPREVREQFSFGEKVKVQDAHTGDLIFFSTEGKGATHVGLVVDRDEFVHAPSARGVVRVEHFSERYWSRRIVGVKRIR